MASNFRFLNKEKKFEAFVRAAWEAEKCYQLGSGPCCLLSRRAADYALHWMLNNDDKLRSEFEAETKESDQKNIYIMLESFAFRNLIPHESIRKLHYIRTKGNVAAHDVNNKLELKNAQESLEGLHFFLAWLNHNYNTNHSGPAPKFDRSLLPEPPHAKAQGSAATAPKVVRTDNLTHVEVYVHFTDALALLTKAEQESVSKVIRQIQSKGQMNPGYSQVVDAECEDLFLLPVGRDFKLYIVLYWRASVCIFLYAADKERALQWAKANKCEVNPQTNTLQVFTLANPGSRDISPEEDRVQGNLAELRKHEGEFVFRSYESKDLLRLGVPDEYIPEIYDVTLQTWPAMRDRLPRQTYDCLSQVLHGAPLERVIKDTYLGGREVASSEDVVKAAANPQTYIAPLQSEEDLDKMLEAPLEKWRVYLHPQQRRLAYRHYEGSARILGAAGTGKSVVAIHHAKFLASDSMPEYSILFTTFTRNLTADLKARLCSICTKEEFAKITVSTLDKLIMDILKNQNGKYRRIQYDGEVLKNTWTRAMRRAGIELDAAYDKSFLMSEWINVVQAQGIRRLVDYQDADRQGRGRRIDREMRAKLWKVFMAYGEIMSEEGWLDRDAAANHCAQQLREEPSLLRFDSIIVDESPDFGPAQFRLLRALCGDAHRDDLYITGDPRQLIYKDRPKLVLSRCGINVRGRSSQLTMNYRTTGNILKWANRLLYNIEYDDLDGGKAEMEVSESVVEGERPELCRFDTRRQELSFIIGKIAELTSKGVPMEEIAVVSRVKEMIKDAQSALASSGIPATMYEGNESVQRGVQLLTMHGSKGLEYSYVFVIGANRSVIPNAKSLETAMDEEEKAELIAKEKQLLYVALTRARINVFVTCSGEPSEFLALLDNSKQKE